MGADIGSTPDGEVWAVLHLFDWSHPKTADAQETLVARFDGNTWHTCREHDGVAFDALGPQALGIDPDGRVLLATSQGLLEFRQGAWHTVQEGSFARISIAPDGTIWLVGDGVFRLRLR